MNVVVHLSQRTRAHVSKPLILWAAVVAICLSVGVGATTSGPIDVALLATLLFGVYLGARGRRAVIVVAPLVSWVVALGPLLVASLVHYGPLSGLLHGLVLVSVGWIVVAGVEVVVLSVGGWCGAAWRRARDRNDVVVISPERSREG